MIEPESQPKRVPWAVIGVVAVLGLCGVVCLVSFAVPAVLMTLLKPSDIRPPVHNTLPLDGDRAMPPGSDPTTAHGEDAAGRPQLGDPAAPITVQVFADFQCPHCKEHHETYDPRFVEAYVATGKVKLVWVTMPFMGDGSPDDESYLAAVAGYCAHDHGQFWAMHDLLFANQGQSANQGSFSRDKLRAMAVDIGLDGDDFAECLDREDARQRAMADRQYATDLDIQSTPTFLVGDDRVEGSGDERYADLTDLVDNASQQAP